MTTNAQLEEKLDNEVIPLLRSNKNRLDDIEPLTRKHELVLYGDPSDRKDGGMVGAFNAMEDLFTSIKGWSVWIARAAILAFLTFIVSQVYQMWLLFVQNQ